MIIIIVIIICSHAKYCQVKTLQFCTCGIPQLNSAGWSAFRVGPSALEHCGGDWLSETGRKLWTWVQRGGVGGAHHLIIESFWSVIEIMLCRRTDGRSGRSFDDEAPSCELWGDQQVASCQVFSINDHYELCCAIYNIITSNSLWRRGGATY